MLLINTGCMKNAFAILLILIAVLAAGCTAAQQTVPAEPVIPGLVGTWTGPSTGYDQATGFTDYRDLGITMVITEQNGRIFSGHILYIANGTESSTGIAGAISRDGKKFSMSEQSGGYAFGEILGPDAFEITYLEDGKSYSAAVDSFTRAG